MTTFNYTEKQFEQDIETSLITYGGYIKGNPATFDRGLGIDKGVLLDFIKSSQPKTWKRYVNIYGNQADNSFIDRFVREVRGSGLLSVLRKGIKDRGINFRLVYFKPETSINVDTAILYDKNIMHCTRQLRYCMYNENSIDMVLSINGIPIVTMELKNQLTGQSTYNSIQQYRHDRNPSDALFTFRQRTLVHFGVDLLDIQMTTRLLGSKTYFLPFNQGSNGAGNVGGAGNPLNEDGYQTAYLWEKVLTGDRLLEIIHKYIHYDKVEDRMIFPRYHQLDVVTKLLQDVKTHGAGKNYLIQHSAGSGKSNSIAWLAHRLSGLHDKDNKKIFKSIIVITDRRVLDSQLQDTIYQFDHVAGVVQKIDKNSQQLKDAINNDVPIIITTLQKFPVIYNEVNTKNSSFAVIVDEAHSSQTGESAKKLKKALANTEQALKEYAEMEYQEEQKRPDDEDKLVSEMLSHGRHDNLSFFAFTATPKDKTLQMFGNRLPNGNFRAFHIYSMKQAIEEGFILDVLKNYMTYSMYYKIIKDIPDDPEIDSSAGIRAIKKFESLHPHNLAQKTAVIIEHFREQTVKQINGKAKAMVVTASRLHAVRYLLEFKRYIKQKGYDNLNVLVAFSGEIEDEGMSYTEEKINKTKAGETIKEHNLRNEFHSNDFNMLIVAEKYQTGFDEPYLHTMFVDKKLSGVKAVQTLSRINRIMKGKHATFVLDFVNTAEEMQKSFQPFYEATVLEKETNPNVVYDLKNALDEYQIYNVQEINSFAKIYFNNEVQGDNDIGKLTAILKPAIDRFVFKTDEEKDEFKSSLATFNRIYAFITQVYRMFDDDLHKFSVYAKFLGKLLPKGKVNTVDLGDKILLEYYRIEKDFEGSILLEDTEGGKIAPIKGETGKRQDNKDTLTQLIDRINEAFGTQFTEMDKVISQIENDFLADDYMKDFAKNNNESMFARIYEEKFKKFALSRYEQNDEFFEKMFSEEKFMNVIMDSLMHSIYRKLKSS